MLEGNKNSNHNSSFLWNRKLKMAIVSCFPEQKHLGRKIKQGSEYCQNPPVPVP
jgi:hypothetical protein